MLALNLYFSLFFTFCIRLPTESISLSEFGFKEINTKEETAIPKGFEKKTTQLILNKKKWIKVKEDLEKKFLLV